MRLIFFTGCLFLISGGLLAQSYIGFHAAINSGKFSGDAPRQFVYKGKFQLNAGIDFDLRLKDDLFLAFSPGYLRSGSKLQYPYETEEEDLQEYRDSIDLKLQMFTLPVLLKIVSDNDRWQFIGGLELGFPIKVVADNSVEEEDVTDEINNTMVSMLFGVGYRIPIEKSYLTINLGYSQGLTNLARNFEDPNSYMPRIRFTSYRLSAVYLLPVGKAKNH